MKRVYGCEFRSVVGPRAGDVPGGTGKAVYRRTGGVFGRIPRNLFKQISIL
jgi:hypothetical protein